MSYEYGAIEGDSIAEVARRIIVKDDDEQQKVNEIVGRAYDVWRDGGSERKWASNKSVPVIIAGTSEYGDAISRLRKAARGLNIMIRPGRVTGPPDSTIYIPFLAMDKPPAKPRPEPKPEDAVKDLTPEHWQAIVDAMRYEEKNTENMERKEQLTRLIEIVAVLAGIEK